MSTVFALLFLTNCASLLKVPDKINREWKLIEFQNFSKDLMVKNNANLNLSTTSATSKRFSAKMGCNQMFGEATFMNSGKVTFSSLGSTMMFCDKNMDLETAFGSELPKMTSYKVEGQFLILSDYKGNKMKFMAADWD